MFIAAVIMHNCDEVRLGGIRSDGGPAGARIIPTVPVAMVGFRPKVTMKGCVRTKLPISCKQGSLGCPPETARVEDVMA